jgi:small conductance mechanosensitive channel
VLLILVLAFVVTRAVGIATGRFERSLGEAAGHNQVERAKRARTLSQLVRSAATIFVVAVATLEVLNELGVNLAPILTGAGILGLAVGFGAQTLVKDVIGGFFLILENQVRVGDVAEINGTGGLVEAINLRTIVLRDVRGAVHVFPCGAVATLTNLTKDFSYAVIDLRVDYQYDTDRVVALLARVSAELAKDPAFAVVILDGLEVLGVEQLGASTVTIRARLKTVPQKQWDVARELRRRIKKTCEAEGIQLSLPPQRVELLPSHS